jgi:PAS domain S-box-containing protein
MQSSDIATSVNDLSAFCDVHEFLMSAPVGVFLSTPEGRYICVNSTLASMLGYDSPQDLLASVTDIASQVYVDPAQREEFKRLLAAHGEVVNFESRFRRKDGSIIWVSRAAWAVRDAKGALSRYQGFTTDITRRKQAEEAIAAANARLEALWSVSSLREADLKRISDHILESLTRMTRSEHGFYGFVDETEERMTLHSWSGNAMRDCSVQTKPQHYRFSEAGVWGEAVRRRMPLIINDFSAFHPAKKGLPQGHSEAALRKQKVMLEHLFESSTDAIAIIDKHGCVLQINKSFANLFGYAWEEVQGRQINDLISRGTYHEEAGRYSHRVFDKGEIIETETVRCKKDGTPSMWFSSDTPFSSMGRSSAPTAFIATSRIESTQKSLRESEERFKALHNASFGGITIHDKGIILDCNQGLSDITGYSVEELIGMNGLLLIAEKSRELVMKNILAGYEKPYGAFRPAQERRGIPAASGGQEHTVPGAHGAHRRIPGRHRAQRSRSGTDQGQRRGPGRQQGQVRIPGQHEP